MSEHVSTERMNEALDGALSSAELEALDRHLDGCAACRNEYARLSEVVSSIRSLPRGGEAPAEAWAGIEARIAATSRDGGFDRDADGEAPSGATVVEFPTAAAVESQRTFSFSAAQLALAACLVAVVSASTVWVALGPADGEAGRAVAASSESLAGAAARAVSLEDSRYGEVVDQLEAILEEGRSVLAPETLVTIEESLNTVNSAIEDIEAALADDPNSDLLLRMLATHRSTKLGVLQRAAAAVQAQV